jgi:hypothetical protein
MATAIVNNGKTVFLIPITPSLVGRKKKLAKFPASSRNDGSITQGAGWPIFRIYRSRSMRTLENSVNLKFAGTMVRAVSR